MLAFGVSIVVSYEWILFLSKRSYSAMEPLSSYTSLVAAAVVPFFFGGLVLSIAFTNAADRIAHLYRVDLTGASLGALVVLPALTAFNGPMLVPVLAAGGVVSGTLLPPRPRAAAALWGGPAAVVPLSRLPWRG